MNEHLDLNRRPGEKERAGEIEPAGMGTGPYGKENAGVPGSSNTGPFPAGQAVMQETSDIQLHGSGEQEAGRRETLENT